MATNSNVNNPPLVAIAPSFDCDISPEYTAEDNETYINKFLFTMIECPELPLNDVTDLWNCNLCGNDEQYWQPCIPGDVFNLQYKANLSQYEYYQAFIYDTAGNIVENGVSPGIVNSFTGDDLQNLFLNYKIYPDNIDAECFYFKLYAFYSPIDQGTLSTCVEAAIIGGQGPQEALLGCLVAQSPEYDSFYSEGYRKTDPECEDTLLIEGSYPKYDCDGHYYQGTPGYIFELKVRVPGTIEMTEYGFEKTEIFNQNVRSKQISTYLLRTGKIPPYVAQQLAAVFNSEVITIDGTVYQKTEKLSKNNEEGQMWIINTTLTTECDEIKFDCE